MTCPSEAATGNVVVVAVLVVWALGQLPSAIAAIVQWRPCGDDCVAVFVN